MSQKSRAKARRQKSEAERRALYMDVASRWLDELSEIKDLTYEEAHLIAYNLLESIEKKMLQMGYRPSELPTYNRRLGGQLKSDAGNFTPCKRCSMCERADDGTWQCQVFRFAIDTSAPFEVAEGDGCARGIPREEYR